MVHLLYLPCPVGALGCRNLLSTPGPPVVSGQIRNFSKSFGRPLTYSTALYTFAHMKTQRKFSGAEFKQQLFFGGSLCSKRAHRVARPLSTKHPLHLILKSSQARGARSFWKKRNAAFIEGALGKFSSKFGIKVIDCVNAGNHLHLTVKLSNRFTYSPFIRALTGAISLRLGGAAGIKKFWDFRPYTRIIVGWKAFLKARDYLAINRLESFGIPRSEARTLVAKAVDPPELAAVRGLSG